jgi:hypothetical protein
MGRSLEVNEFVKVASTDKIIFLSEDIRILVREKFNKCEG